MGANIESFEFADGIQSLVAPGERLVLDPQAVLPAILIRSESEAEDREDQEVSRWAGPL